MFSARDRSRRPYAHFSDPLTMMGSSFQDDPVRGTVLKIGNLLREGSRARERTMGAEGRIRPEGQYLSHPCPISGDAGGGNGFAASRQKTTATDCGLRSVTARK